MSDSLAARFRGPKLKHHPIPGTRKGVQAHQFCFAFVTGSLRKHSAQSRAVRKVVASSIIDMVVLCCHCCNEPARFST